MSSQAAQDTTNGGPLRQGWLHYVAITAVYALLYTLFFSPALFSSRLLAPGDGWVFYLPNFFVGVMLWDPSIWGGFPVAADPQAMSWYPLSLVFSWLSSWNGFVLSAYVVASVCTYGYVRTLTGSSLAGMFSGIVYGMSGFMIAHLGHTSVIHASAWLPLLIWGLEKLHHRFDPLWFVAVSGSVACCALSGHPQIVMYAVSVGAAYAVFRTWSVGGNQLRRLVSWGGAFLLGMGLASIQYIPSVELANLGVRAKMDFAGFVTYSLHPLQSIELLFPYLFGGIAPSLYRTPYFGPWNLTEISGYVGILPLLVAAAGLAAYRRTKVAWFWVATGVVSFLLVLGDFTPLARLVYHVPVFNKFRVPARHFVEFSFAASILSGLGIAAVQAGLRSRKDVMRTSVAGAVVMLAGFLAIVVFAGKLQTIAESKGIRFLGLVPWANPAVGIPLVVFTLATLVLIFWSSRPGSKCRSVCLITVLIIDMGSFGWFYEWKYGSPGNELVHPPPVSERYKELLGEAGQRVLPLRGGHGGLTELPPNISRVWGNVSASGYGPLILSRVSQLLGMGTPGDVHVGNLSRADNRALDLMATRFVFLPQGGATTKGVLGPEGIVWSPEDMSLTLGSGCGQSHPLTKRLQFSEPIEASAIGIVSALACSPNLPDDAEVLRIIASDAYGGVQTVSMRAGRHTSEWAFDRRDVQQIIRHSRAPIYKSNVITEGTTSYKGHQYAAVLPFSGALQIRRIDLQWVGQSYLMGILKISLFHEGTKRSYPVSQFATELGGTLRWRHVEDIGGISVYENLRAMPRAWLVAEVMTAGPEEVLAAVQTSRLPDGSAFDPAMTALVEEPLTLRETADSTAGARIVELSARRIEVLTESAAPSFLVLSDVNYPGWRATVDNAPAKVYQTNYLFRGVPVPAGSHRVVFEFKPLTLYAGAGISLLSFGIISVVFVRSLLTRRSGTESPPEAQAARRS